MNITLHKTPLIKKEFMNWMRLNKKIVGVFIGSAYFFSGHVVLAATLTVPPESCAVLLDEVASGHHPTHIASTAKKTTGDAWTDSVQALKQIDQTVYGRHQVIEALTTAILAKEFVWINGEPGGAKTFLSRIMFQSVLNAIPEADKKVFVLQFHKLISEGKITGFQKFSSMMKDGKYEIETESSLVGDRFLFLIADEAEKANPAVLNALLSVLNERKAFLGAKVVDAVLSSGVFTSNKTTGEFIQGFLNDRPSGEALLDRMAVKIHIPNQQLSAKETVAMYDLVKNPGKSKITLPLRELEAVVAKVKIPDDMMAEIVSIAREFDRYVTNKADQSKTQVRYGERDSEYFPANQFSNRSVRRLVQIFKSALVAHQLMEGVPFDQMRLTPQRQDLSLLALSALYAGPSGLTLKTYSVTEVSDGITVTSTHGTSSKMAVHYSPFDGQLLLQDGSGKTQFAYGLNGNSWVLKSKSPEFADWSIDTTGFAALAPKIKSVVQANKIDLSKPQFEVDKNIDQLLAKGTVKERTRVELESIKKDLEQFANVLSQHFDKDQPAVRAPQEKLLPQRSEKEKRQFRREMLAAKVEERVSRYYDWMGYEVRALKQRFVELDYSIEAHLTGILSDNHLYVFGPPGGAKTALAEVILKSELKKMNTDKVDQFVKSTLAAVGHDQKFVRAILKRVRAGERPEQFDRFLLQFHKLLPEGVLIGFPKVEKQLNEGKEEIEVSTSLANQKFIFAILDEVDKANPQTITALLSILNEREVFAGNQVIKTALRTAILTSNKMPSEFLDSYHEDRSTGEAVMDRAPNKVFVSNKISSEEALTQFLINLEKGISPSWKGLLAIGELEPIVKQVEFENPALKELLAKVHEKFLASRINKEEETRKAHKMDPREFPDYYVSAAGSASDRTVIRLFDQLKARFIVHQLMEGVAFKDLRTTIEMKDLGLFFEGLGYWAPQKISHSYGQDGLLHFSNSSPVIERLISSGVVDARVKFHLEMMLDEAKDFVQVLNSVTHEFMDSYKKEITKYPDLFPSLFVSDKSRPTVAPAMSGQRPNLTPDLQKSINQAIKDLSQLRLNLDVAKSKGHTSPEITALTSDYKKKEQALVEYLEKYKIMTRPELVAQMKREIEDAQKLKQSDRQKEDRTKEEEERRRKEQEEQIKNSVVDGTKGILNRVEPGSFKMGEVGSQINVEISKPFDMMATPTTQVVWKKVADLANKIPGKLGGVFGAKYKINADPSNFKGDLHPVEKVSYEEIKTWISALNDLSQAGDPALNDLFPGHKKGDVYRLPSEAEWEFVIRGRGQFNDAFHFGNNEADLGKYAWFSGNSGSTTHPVAKKDPLIVNGKEFYDMHGNVWEWVEDAWADKLPGGKDPVVNNGSHR
ncbi:MAG: SUMF1/EgtB/PvdO family nonheme iron enzyme, partial [Oligoflexia bacterium]|nr:SUMF1/EgtB/PvdO family nonheme iron enzyme [Oligoflexia bacterium]